MLGGRASNESKSFKVGPFGGLPQFYYPHVPVCRRDLTCTNQMCAYIHPEREASKTKWVFTYTKPVARKQKPTGTGRKMTMSAKGKRSNTSSAVPQIANKTAFPALPSSPVSPSNATTSRSMWGNGSLYNMEPSPPKKSFAEPFGSPAWSFAAQQAAERSFNTPTIRNSPMRNSPLRENNWPESLNHVLAGVSSLVDDVPISPASLAVAYSPLDQMTATPSEEVEVLRLSPTIEEDEVVEIAEPVSKSDLGTTTTTPTTIFPLPVEPQKEVSTTPEVAPKKENVIQETIVPSPMTSSIRKRSEPKQAEPKEVFAAKSMVMEEPAELESEVDSPYRRFSLRGGKVPEPKVSESSVNPTENMSSVSIPTKRSKNTGRNRKKVKGKKAGIASVASLDQAHKTETQHLDIPLPPRNIYQPTPLPQLVLNSLVSFFLALGALFVSAGVGFKDVLVGIWGVILSASSSLHDTCTAPQRRSVNNNNRSRRSKR